MKRQTRVILNIIALQSGWFACVLGAAKGMPQLGPIVVLAFTILHLSFSPRRIRDVIVLGVAVIVGIVADGVLLRAGAIAFESGVVGGYLIPLWMMALWLNFATSLNLTLEFLQGRVALAILFGAVGGVAAYVGGNRLGALNMPSGVWAAGWAVALEWAIVTPLLVWLAARVDLWTRPPLAPIDPTASVRSISL